MFHMALLSIFVAYVLYRTTNVFVAHLCMRPQFPVFVALTMCRTSKFFVAHLFLRPQFSVLWPCLCIGP